MPEIERFKSRVLLRRAWVEEYVAEGEGWSSDRVRARNFGTLWAADAFAEEHPQAAVEVVVAFKERQFDVVLPCVRNRVI